MVAGVRLGGHIVSGHVDAVATVQSVEQSGDARLVALALPAEVMELSVLHGSVTFDGAARRSTHCLRTERSSCR
jgi:riboflavin synthase